jgi:hypothetical protein
MPLRYKVYAFRYLLGAAQQAYIRANKKNEGRVAKYDDAFMDYMVVVLFCALALEAYLNHIGPSIIKNWAPLKKKLSPREKLDVFLAERSRDVDFSKSPYQSFERVFQFRNAIAHAETEVVEYQVNHRASPPQTKWQKYCTKAVAEKVLKDTVKIIDTLAHELGVTMDIPSFLLAETL